MEVKEFIASGIIESYLLGTATQKEVDLVHAMIAKHPSLKIEIDSVEDALLIMAEKNSPSLDPQLKERILNSIPFNQSQENNNHNSAKLANGKTVSMPGSNKRPAIKYGLVASIGLLIISTVLNVLLFNSNRKMVSEVNKLGYQTTEMQQSIASYMEIVNDMNKDFEILTKNRSIELKGTDVSPSSLATVYYNDQTKEVYLYVNNLPDPPTDMQYQLWAIVDGKPVDAGVFETGKQNSLQDMLKASGTPQAFAVTLEKRGGSPTPTMEAMFLIGEV